MKTTTAPSCQEPAAAGPEAIGPHTPSLTEIEIEILVRLLGYGCAAAKAAIYLDRPAGLIERELKRLGFRGEAREGPDSVTGARFRPGC